MPCRCTDCTHLDVYPTMPYLDPPDVPDAWADPRAEWTVACNWLSPLVNGRAVLILRGTKTDGGSIPPSAWSMVGHPWQMPCLPYFLQHDAETGAELYRMAVCDARLFRNMAADGHISPIKRRVIYRSCLAYHATVKSRHTPESVARYRATCRIVGEEEYAVLSSCRSLQPITSNP